VDGDQERNFTKANKIHVGIIHLVIPFTKILEPSFNGCRHLMELGVPCHVFP
jgi:hypothetical protein